MVCTEKSWYDQEKTDLWSFLIATVCICKSCAIQLCATYISTLHYGIMGQWTIVSNILHWLITGQRAIYTSTLHYLANRAMCNSHLHLTLTCNTALYCTQCALCVSMDATSICQGTTDWNWPLAIICHIYMYLFINMHCPYSK